MCHCRVPFCRPGNSSTASTVMLRDEGEAVQRTVADFAPVNWPDVVAVHGMARRESSTRPARMAPSVSARASPAWMAMKVPLEARPSMPTAKTRTATRTSGRVNPWWVMEGDHRESSLVAFIFRTRRPAFERTRGSREKAKAQKDKKSLCALPLQLVSSLTRNSLFIELLLCRLPHGKLLQSTRLPRLPRRRLTRSRPDRYTTPSGRYHRG